MKILAMDTSNHTLGVALLDDGQIIGEITTNIKKNHSVRLMPAIEQLMNDVTWKPEDLDQIAVAEGPGSYTGVRIGVSTAKTMAWGLDIPLVGVSSLEVLAYQGKYFDGWICPFFDARRGNVFTAVYEYKGGKLQTVKEEQNLLFADYLSDLKASGKPVLFLSPDIDIHLETIREVMGDSAVIPEQIDHLPRAVHLALLSMRKDADSLHDFVPNYLRLAEAEAKWMEQQEEKKNHENRTN